MNTVQQHIAAIAERFDSADLVYGHGTDNAWDEAVALVLGVTAYPDAESSLSERVSASDAQRCEDLAGKRITQRMPLAYLLGEATFCGLKFAVEPGVVIPRSPIGQLITAGFSPWMYRSPQHILDLGCGSGCIGIAAALFLDADLTLVDLDAQAIDLARKNLHRHGLDNRTTLIHGDLYNDLPAGARFDLILTNPPYVDATDMRSLPPEYQWEPTTGLGAGGDGLDVIRRILDSAGEYLTEEGLFVGEVGASTAALLSAYPHIPFIWPDLAEGGEGVFVLDARSLSFHTPPPVS
jgi:ribosomal protein L3 glutamine methyltransferase